jgi:hypothetical protein
MEDFMICFGFAYVLDTLDRNKAPSGFISLVLSRCRNYRVEVALLGPCYG